jgi:hypothetical protein
MRLRVSGEKSIIERMDSAFDSVDERKDGAPDAMELKFSVVLLATIVGLVANSTKLVEFFGKICGKLKPEETQKLQLTTPLGTATITLRKDATPEELRAELKALFGES